MSEKNIINHKTPHAFSFAVNFYNSGAATQSRKIGSWISSRILGTDPDRCQGVRIGHFFAYWVNLYFGQFFENKKILGIFFYGQSYVLTLTKRAEQHLVRFFRKFIYVVILICCDPILLCASKKPIRRALPTTLTRGVAF
jgi:hypothetical protein